MHTLFQEDDQTSLLKRIRSALGYLTPLEFQEQWRLEHSPLAGSEPTTTRTGAEDRATVGTDPSADSGMRGRQDVAPSSLSGTKR